MPSDRLTAAQRSKNMSRIRSVNTGPELTVRRLLHRAGYRYRLHRRDLPGTPDIYMPRHKLAIFVSGCFWHGHEGCTRATIPKTRTDFWAEKIASNQRRDAQAAAALKAMGVRAITIWQCELKDLSAVLFRVNQATGRNQGDPR